MELFLFLQAYTKKGSIISLVGAGGKSSTLYALAGSALREKVKTLLTTTTLMIDPGSDPLARGIPVRYTRTPDRNLLPDSDSPVLFGASEMLEGAGKVKGFSPDQIDSLAPFWDMILVEADGAKHRPVKAPAEHEPVIPQQSDIVLGCIGLDCIGKPFSTEIVHRPGHFSRITGLKEGEIISLDSIVRLVNHPTGLFKSLPRDAHPIVLLNKAELIKPDHLKEMLAALGSSRIGGSPPTAVLAVSMGARRAEKQVILSS